MGTDKRLAELVARDKEIEQRQHNASLALMEHRWKVVNGDGYDIREYARAIRRADVTVFQYIHAWELWRTWEGDPSKSGATPSDALSLAKLNADEAEAVTIVAEARGIKPGTVTKNSTYRDEVRGVRDNIELATEKLVKTGVSRPKAREQTVAKVAKHTATKIRVAQKQAQRRKELAKSHSRGYLMIERDLLKARAALNGAKQLAQDAELRDDEQIELVDLTLRSIRTVIEEIAVLVTGTTEIDWDADASDLLDD